MLRVHHGPTGFFSETIIHGMQNLKLLAEWLSKGPKMAVNRIPGPKKYGKHRAIGHSSNMRHMSS